MFDTTDRIIRELECMIIEGLFSLRPTLEKEIKELIRKVNSREANLFDYRRHNSKEKFGSEIVEAITEANFRQQQRAKE